MTTNLTKLFVYGTLMRKHRNSHFMKGSVFVGAAITAQPDYEMKLLESRSLPGRYSPVVVSEGEGYIAGEVYEVDDKALYTIDTLEGSRYKRMMIETNIGLAEIYLYSANDKFIRKADEAYKAHIKFHAQSRTYSWSAEHTGQESELGLQA